MCGVKIIGLEAEFREGGPPEMLILAEDAAQWARMARRIKAYDDLSLADLARSVAERLGRQPVVTGLSDRLGTWVQFNESDLAFLRRGVGRHGGGGGGGGGGMYVLPRPGV